MDEGTATTASDLPRGRVDAALRSRANWEQLVKFCVVGATGYAVNLVVYTLLLKQGGLHYTAAAIGSFLVAVTNNYAWNRLWTFRGQRGHVVFQGLRFLVVSTMALVANLVVLHLLVQAGLHYTAAAIGSFLVAVTNNYAWNRLWTFRGQRGHVVFQGLRFLVVSTMALVANLVVLHLLVQAGLGEIVAQALAIMLVTPVNFVGNKLWSFRHRR